MQQKESKKELSYKSLEVISLEGSIKVTMPDEILNKIKFLCKNIAQVEWSGVLFYQIDGSITDAQNLNIILKDILPLDKGTSGYTEYDLDDRLIDYMMDNPDSQDWKIGHIHSHNTMSVFFSGTDMDELKENSGSHNFYLSLIVNNYMDFKAKVAFRGKSKMASNIVLEDFTALDENGESYVLLEGESEEKQSEIEKMFVYDCEIDSSVETISVDSTFQDKVKTIMETKKTNPTSKTHWWNPTTRNWERRTIQQPQITRGFTDDVADIDFQEEFFSNPVGSFNPVDEQELEAIEQMIIAIMKGTNPPLKKDTVESVIVALCIGDESISGDKLKDRFSDYLVSMFERYIPNADRTDLDRFQFIVEEIADILKEYETPYPFLVSSVQFLDNVVSKLDKDAVTD